MKSFREISFKKTYDSYSDQEEFENAMIKLLSNSKNTKILTAYFNSNVFRAIVDTLIPLIKNKSKMNILIDLKGGLSGFEEKIKPTIENVHKKIEEDINNIVEEVQKDSLAVLYYLVKNNYININYIYDKNKPIHTKKYILEDKEQNKLVFSGSQNFTYSGFKKNYENMEIFSSWDDKERVEGHVKIFNDYNNDPKDRFEKLDFSKTMSYIEKMGYSKRISSASELNRIIKKLITNNDIEKGLRFYQTDSVNDWFKTKKGIIELPTGTGKSRIGWSAITKYMLSKKKSLAVIVAPTIPILDQWYFDYAIDYVYSEKMNLNQLFVARGSNWKSEIKRKIANFNQKFIKDIVVFVSYDTFCSETFINEISKFKTKNKLILCDEVHNAGATLYQKGLLSEYSARIGLSATPKRYFDDEGSKKLIKYFTRILESKLTLKDAIYKYKYLNEYTYNLKEVYLNKEEDEKYENLTKRIAQVSHNKSISKTEKERELKELTRYRSDIIKNVESKIKAFKEICKTLDFRNTIIFTAPKFKKEVLDYLLSKGIDSHLFTSEISEKRRRVLKKEFSEGKIDVLVGIKILDEGINIPSAEKAIIMSSTGNEKEFIQRRGRLLRKYKGKAPSKIIDIVVRSKDKTNDLNITKKEKKRVEIYSESSNNKKKIEAIIKKWN